MGLNQHGRGCYWLRTFSIRASFALFIFSISCKSEIPPFEFEDGLLTVDVEDLPEYFFKESKWELDSQFTGFQGRSYAIWKGDAIWGNTSQPDDDPDRYLKFRINVEDSGRYYIKVRNYHQKMDGDNDVFIRTSGWKNEDYLKFYDHDENVWTLDETGFWAEQNLSKGIHSVEIAGRSHGFAVDQLIIYKEGTVMPQAPVNPNATEETKKLLSYLYEVRENGGILSGMHNELDEPTLWDNNLKARNGNITPAIWGSDFRYGKHVKHRSKMINEAIRQHREEGRIITLMYHQVRPMDDEECCGEDIWAQSVQGDITDAEMDSLLTDGSGIHAKWQAKWDTVATYLQQLEDARVPVLFRPYHEMNGDWFWWGRKAGYPHEGEGERDHQQDKFKKLYQMTYNYLTYEKGINNLLWVFNMDDTDNNTTYFYPGDNYVDIVATDVYQNKHSPEHYQSLQEIAGEKLIALGEVSSVPAIEELKNQYSDYVWFMGWRKLFIEELNDEEEGHSKDELEKIFQDDYVINAEDLPKLSVDQR